MEFTNEEKTALSLCISDRMDDLEKKINIIKSIIDLTSNDDLKKNEKRLLELTSKELKTLRNIFKKF